MDSLKACSQAVYDQVVSYIPEEIDYYKVAHVALSILSVGAGAYFGMQFYDNEVLFDCAVSVLLSSTGLEELTIAGTDVKQIVWSALSVCGVALSVLSMFVATYYLAQAAIAWEGIYLVGCAAHFAISLRGLAHFDSLLSDSGKPTTSVEIIEKKQPAKAVSATVEASASVVIGPKPAAAATSTAPAAAASTAPSIHIGVKVSATISYGFPNLGNTCFANSFLKAFMQTPAAEAAFADGRNLTQRPPTVNHIDGRDWTVAGETKADFEVRVKVFQALKNIYKEFKSTNPDQAVITANLRAAFASSYFRSRGLIMMVRQEDSHQFGVALTQLLEVDSVPAFSVQSLGCRLRGTAIDVEEIPAYSEYSSIIELNNNRVNEIDTMTIQELLTEYQAPEVRELDGGLVAFGQRFVHDDVTQLRSIGIRLPRFGQREREIPISTRPEASRARMPALPAGAAPAEGGIVHHLRRLLGIGDPARARAPAVPDLDLDDPEALEPGLEAAEAAAVPRSAPARFVKIQERYKAKVKIDGLLDPIVLPVFDKRTGRVVNVTLNVKSVVCHSGGLSGGHYIAVIKKPNGSWEYHSDSSVMPERNPSDTASQQGYIAYFDVTVPEIAPAVAPAAAAAAEGDADMEDGAASHAATDVEDEDDLSSDGFVDPRAPMEEA